ncbi:MAG: hypothetical protein IPK48_01455 [Gammaproteobacteria bacterium]|nr:hypothetical protein [Gammaproteobacteria bacterium]
MRLPDKLRALFRSRKSRESATTDRVTAGIRDAVAAGKIAEARGLELIRRAEALRP